MNNSINELGFKLLNSQPIVSGYSIWSALFMVYLGVTGGSAAEKELNNFFNVNIMDIFKQYSKVNKDLKTRVSINNCIFIKNNFKVNEKYKELIKGSKIGMLSLTDFDKKDIDLINKWIAARTGNMIRDILQSENVNEETRLILVNTIYFNKKWVKPFNKKNTKKEKFIKINGSTILCDLMLSIEYGRYYEDSLVQTYEKMYVNQLVFGCMLPKNKIIEMSKYNLPSYINKMKETKVKLYLPKFEQDSRVSVKDTLKEMGVTKIFVERGNYLDKIANNLYVSDIIHQAKIKLEEEGTEASAASVVIINKAMFAYNPVKEPDPIIIRADHSFVWYIRDITTNVVIFSGVYNG
jgi:serpin B